MKTQQKVTFDGNMAHAETPEGQKASIKIQDLVDRAAPRHMDTCGIVIPNGIRLIYSQGRFTIWVCEVAPSVVGLKWIARDSPAPYGPESKYSRVRIALPYVIVVAVFDNGRLSEANECFFRVGPLESENDELLYPALLNCSKFHSPAGRPLSWICTQHLDRRPLITERDPARRMRRGLKALLHCLLETGFNYSSEHHEYSSWFTESKGVDPRISSIENWEKATNDDPNFVLEVPWLKANVSVRQLADRIFTSQRASNPNITTVFDLARLILGK
jgi:hypothetical protein